MGFDLESGLQAAVGTLAGFKEKKIYEDALEKIRRKELQEKAQFDWDRFKDEQLIGIKKQEQEMDKSIDPTTGLPVYISKILSTGIQEQKARETGFLPPELSPEEKKRQETVGEYKGKGEAYQFLPEPIRNKIFPEPKPENLTLDEKIYNKWQKAHPNEPPENFYRVKGEPKLGTKEWYLDQINQGLIEFEKLDPAIQTWLQPKKSTGSRFERAKSEYDSTFK